MKLEQIITENFQTVSINGILYSLNTDEKGQAQPQGLYARPWRNERPALSSLYEFDMTRKPLWPQGDI